MSVRIGVVGCGIIAKAYVEGSVALGSAYETARDLIAEGAIGTPLSATATFLVGGPDSWHPNADVFYQAGGGPMLDIAPYYLTAIASLLGPFRAALGLATTPTPERRFGVGPRA